VVSARRRLRGYEKAVTMGIGVSIFLIAVGAILTFAVEADISGLDISTVGVILMIVGALGLLASMTIFGSWGATRRGVVAGDTAYTERTVVRERDVI
jgi:hypothetical protein